MKHWVESLNTKVLFHIWRRKLRYRLCVSSSTVLQVGDRMCEEDPVGWRMKMAEQNNQQKKAGQQAGCKNFSLSRFVVDKLHELQANGKNPFEITKI